MSGSGVEAPRAPTKPRGGAGGAMGVDAQAGQPSRRGFPRWLVPYIALVVLVIYFTAKSGEFLTISNILVMMQQASILMVIALGATLVVVAGSVDLSVGAVATLVGVFAAKMALDGETWTIWLLVFVGAGCGLVNGILVAYLKLPSFLVTLGTLFIFGGIAAKITNGYTIQLEYLGLDSAVNGTALWGIPNGVLWAVAAIVLSTFLAYRTTFGRRVYAIGGNEKVAELSGLPVARTKVAMFVYSGMLAAFGGLMLTARGGGSSPQMGEAFLLTAIAAIVMGGTSLTGGNGGPARTILGVATIAVLSNGMVLTGVNPYYQNIVLGAVIIGAVIVTIKRSEMAAIK